MSRSQVSLSRRSLLGMFGTGLAGLVGGSLITGRLNATQTGAPLPPRSDAVQVAPVSITTRSGLRVHAVQTGYVAVKRAHYTVTSPESLRLAAIALDTEWTDWMPVMAWVIEHSEGVIVVDTGETSRVREADYFNCDPATEWIIRNNLRFSVTPADELAAQLPALDIDPLAVRWVVQTHLHTDHMGGMGAFPKATFVVPEADYPVSAGTLPCRYPSWLRPEFPAYIDHAQGSFARSAPLTRAGDVVIVPTHGHTPAHQSVVLMDNDRDYLFAGDASFDEAQVRDGVIAGIVADAAAARATLRTLNTYLSERPTVYLPTHDADGRRRFAEGVTTTV